MPEHFAHQIGGHNPIFRHESEPKYIVKPTCRREVDFYQSLMISRHALLEFIPKFVGIDGEDKVIMQDLTFGMMRPCILDVKIGRRLYDFEATPEKVAKRIIKSENTTSGLLGFRLCGLKVSTVEGGPVLFRKPDLASLKEAEIQDVLNLYLNPLDLTARQQLLRFYLFQLDEMHKVVTRSNFEMVCSSILLIYDLDNPINAFCKMIDFAHSRLHHDPLYSDQNYLEGLGSFISFLKNKLGDNKLD